MTKQRRQIALTLVWIAGALLFAFGRPALFGAGASGNGAATEAALGATQLGSHMPSDAVLHALRHQAGAAHDAVAYDKLAEAYVEAARMSGNAAEVALATQAAAHAVSLNPKDARGLLDAAVAALLRQDAHRAAGLARRALAVDGGQAGSYGVLGDADLGLGDYSGAVAAYQHMVDLKPDALSYTRAAHIHFLYADYPGAQKIMRLAIASAAGAPGAPAALAMAHTQLGDDYFALGSPLAAAAEYKAALRADVHQSAALIGLARIYAGQGRYSAAVSSYKTAIAAAPRPQDVIALGDTYARMGQPAQARKQYALADSLLALSARNGIDVAVERSQFLSDHQRDRATALSLVRRETAWRRDVHTMDVLAWALYQNGQNHAALDAEQQALRLGSRDSAMYYHMGLIYIALGDLPSARSFLQGALLLNPFFDVRQEPIALAALRRIESLRPAAKASRLAASDGSHVSVAVTPGP